MRNKTIISALAIILLISGSALAHKGATGIVKIRMDAMSAIGDNMKSISAMLTGKTPFNSTQISVLAKEISNHAAMFPDHFQEKIKSKHTEAAPTIWQKPDTFKAISVDLADFANALSNNAIKAEDPSPLMADFKSVAGTCKSCHEQFRIKK